MLAGFLFQFCFRDNLPGRVQYQSQVVQLPQIGKMQSQLLEIRKQTANKDAALQRFCESFGKFGQGSRGDVVSDAGVNVVRLGDDNFWVCAQPGPVDIAAVMGLNQHKTIGRRGSFKETHCVCRTFFQQHIVEHLLQAGALGFGNHIFQLLF